MTALSSLEEDASLHMAALNFFLSASLLKLMKSSSGKLQFCSVGKKEADVCVVIATHALESPY